MNLGAVVVCTSLLQLQRELADSLVYVNVVCAAVLATTHLQGEGNDAKAFILCCFVVES